MRRQKTAAKPHATSAAAAKPQTGAEIIHLPFAFDKATERLQKILSPQQFGQYLIQRKALDSLPAEQAEPEAQTAPVPMAHQTPAAYGPLTVSCLTFGGGSGNHGVRYEQLSPPSMKP